ATSCPHSASYSSAVPSHQWMSAGWRMPAQWSTHCFSFSLPVVPLIVRWPPISLRMGVPTVAGARNARSASLRSRRRHVGLRAEEQPRGPPDAVEVEDDPLALAEHAQHRALEGVGAQVVVGEVGVAGDDAVAGDGVVGLDDALHARRLSRRARRAQRSGPW